jgi:hypothetical protein
MVYDNTPELNFTPHSTRQLIESLKEKAEDHEFYPTTNEILDALTDHIRKQRPQYTHHKNYASRSDLTSVLDIGAGNGKVLIALREKAQFKTLHAIEKSPSLCAQLNKDILITGTDFYEQSLVTKNVDVVYCNPPYSDFENWTVKIIREIPAHLVYLLIPSRWNQSQPIADALRFRDATTEIVGTYSFLQSEDRPARANVQLLCITLNKTTELNDAFQRIFEEQYQFEQTKTQHPKTGTPKPDPRAYQQLLIGENYPHAMVNLYNLEMQHIQSNINAMSRLDPALLKEFNIFPSTLMQALEEKLKNLKNRFWKELFKNLSAITDRLCSKTQAILLGTLNKHAEVDFTVNNIHAVIVWLIKNTNAYIDIQLIDTYSLLIDKANVKLYKSNHKLFVQNDWRYQHDENSHFLLDYRIVTHRVGSINISQWTTKQELSENGAHFIQDLLTIANNMGFPTQTQDPRLSYPGKNNWVCGQKEEFYFKNQRNEQETLFEVKGHKNGNMHFRFNKEFMLALNVEHGRLKGWLRSGAEAVEETGEPSAAKYFNKTLQIPLQNPHMLLAQPTHPNPTPNPAPNNSQADAA